LIENYNDTGVAYPKDKTIIDLFEEQSAKTPNAIAVSMQDEQLTYQQLNERSNQLGRYLKDKGVTCRNARAYLY
jgi:non-ribosomal peptide synthetase component F